MGPAPDLERRTLADLHALAAEHGVPRFRTLRREALIEALRGEAGSRLEIDSLEQLDAPTRGKITGGPSRAPRGAPIEADHDERARERRLERSEAEPAGRVVGVLDIVPDGFGFLRVGGLVRSDDDVFVSRAQVRDLGLRPGDQVAGAAERRRNDRHPTLVDVESVNGEPPAGERPAFERLTPLSPAQALPLRPRVDDLGLRMLEIAAPLRRGQRYVISAPPRSGATTIVRAISSALAGVEDARLSIVLLDARPEEATEWKRSVRIRVDASESDRSAAAHVQFADLALERAKRTAERGEHAVLVIDSMTRLARAHAIANARRGDAGQDAFDGESLAPALERTKRFLAAARDSEEGGSLTVVATVRAGSDSQLEQLVHETLADVASAELRLDGELASSGLWPAIDVNRSYSRLEGALAATAEAETLQRLRRSFNALPAPQAWQQLADRVRETGSNEELLAASWGV